jgi:hypothetical protein
MQNEMFGHIRSEINQRTTNPYFFCFITALAFYNYDLILIALSGTTVTYKLALMSNALSNKTHWSYGAPLLYALGAYVFIALTSISKYWWEKANVLVENKILKLQDKKTILMSRYRELEKIIEDKDETIDNLQDRHRKSSDEIEEYKNKISKLSKNQRSLDLNDLIVDDKSKEQSSMDINELLRKLKDYKIKNPGLFEENGISEIFKLEEAAKGAAGLKYRDDLLNKNDQ